MDRCLQPPGFGNVVCSELHHFSDASEQGYGAVSYLRSVNANGDIHCSFVLGKSRVTTLRRMTIPRLELTAATVAVRLDKLITKKLDIKVEKSTFWTSTAVLQYNHNEDKRFRTFVANRISMIPDRCEPYQWRYISFHHHNHNHNHHHHYHHHHHLITFNDIIINTNTFPKKNTKINSMRNALCISQKSI